MTGTCSSVTWENHDLLNKLLLKVDELNAVAKHGGRIISPAGRSDCQWHEHVSEETKARCARNNRKQSSTIPLRKLGSTEETLVPETDPYNCPVGLHVVNGHVSPELGFCGTEVFGMGEEGGTGEGRVTRSAWGTSQQYNEADLCSDKEELAVWRCLKIDDNMSFLRDQVEPAYSTRQSFEFANEKPSGSRNGWLWNRIRFYLKGFPRNQYVRSGFGVRD